MSTAMLTLDHKVYERLQILSDRIGQSPEAILDEALVDYERKLEVKELPPMAPIASTEAELLDDPGRIRMPPRNQRTVQAHIVSIGRQSRPTASEED